MRVICVVGLLLFSLECISQSLVSSRSFGGSQYDVASSILATPDGGSISAGYTNSNNGHVSGYKGNTDGWIVKLDAAGNLQWQRCIGGSQQDYATSVILSGDGGYLITGYTYSTDGDMTTNHGNWDAFVAKLNATGTVIWKYCYGDAYEQKATAITRSLDGGYLLVGSSFVSFSSYNRNYAVKINPNGIEEWSYTSLTYSNAQSSSLGDVIPTADSGFLCAGGAGIYWKGGDGHLIKLSKAGSLQWAQLYGSSFNETFSKLTRIDQGNIIVSGSAFNPADQLLQAGHSGQWDYWTLKIDTAGTVVWQKFFGGSSNDHAKAAVKTGDGGVAVIGYTESNDSLVSGRRGSMDAWLVKLSANGNLLWQRTYGGNGTDNALAMTEAGTDTLVVAGYSSDIGDHVHANSGGSDMWIIRLRLHELPDLEINSASISSVLSTGNNFTVYYDVKNSGAGPADPVRVSFYLSSDSIFTPGKNGDTLLGNTGLISALAVGQTGNAANHTLLMPCNRTAGIYYMFVLADGLRQLPESNENNNSLSRPFNLVIDKNNPVPLISVIPADTVCAGSNVQLTITNASSCTGCVYSWNTGSTNANIIVSSTNVNATYNYVVTVANSCGTTTATKRIYYATPPNLSTAASPSAICMGDSVTLSATGALAYAWSGIGLASGTGIQVKAGSTTAGNMSFTVTGSNGGTCTASKNMTISVTSCTVNATYTFTGTGNWTNAANWLNGQLPPDVLPNGTEVIVIPAMGGECILNKNITLAPGAKLSVEPGSKLVINGNINYL